MRKGTSTTAPARPASVKPRPSSPVVVDLCVSPLPQPRARTTNAAAIAADSHSDKANEIEMEDASQSPVREAQPVISRKASAAVGLAKGKAPVCLSNLGWLSPTVLIKHYTYLLMLAMLAMLERKFGKCFTMFYCTSAFQSISNSFCFL